MVQAELRTQFVLREHGVLLTQQNAMVINITTTTSTTTNNNFYYYVRHQI